VSRPEITLHKFEGKVMKRRERWKGKGKPIWFYAEDFRIKVVKEIESGFISKEAVRRKYGIGGKTTVLSWCRKYGRKDYPYMPKEIINKYKNVDAKDKRISELEALLKQKEVAIDALESLIEVANEMYDTNLKKKVGLKRSKK
jgi:transposase-like protein